MDENCIFCKIIRGDFNTEFVYENAISGINFEKKQDKKPLSKDEFYRKKVKSIEPKL